MLPTALPLCSSPPLNEISIKTESFIPGKAASRESTIETMRASAQGAFFERLNTHDFWTHCYLGEKRANRPVVHYPQER